MIKSIQQFQEEGLVNLENIFMDYSDDLTKIAEMVAGVKDNVLELARNLIAEEWEFYDKKLKKDSIRKEKWEIVRTDETSLLTSIGTIRYHKTYYRNKEKGEYCYLLDKAMGLNSHERMTEDAEAELLKEAVESSYRKGGESASITDEAVSQETVMNKIHRLEFPKVEAQPEKKQVKYLYIDADEDHKDVNPFDADWEPEEIEDDGYDDVFDTCPDCGCGISLRNDGGNGFCIDCAWNH